MSAAHPRAFVVVGSHGEYSDRKVWVVAALESDRATAQVWADRASAQARELWEYRRAKDYDEEVFAKDDATLMGEEDRWRTEMDPECDPTGMDPTDYSLHEVPVIR